MSVNARYANESPAARERRRASVKACRARNLDERRRQDREYYRRVRIHNPEKMSAQGRSYYRRNRAKVLARTTAYRKRRPEVARKAYRTWYAKNKQSVLHKKLARDKARRMSDPLYRFLCRFRISICKRLDAYRLKKSNKMCDMLGCDSATLTAFIESQFLPGMSWENRAEWHLDHVLPLKAFALDNPDEQRAAFHFSNLKPIWKSENLRKGANIEPASIAAHQHRFAHAGLVAKVRELTGGVA